jgi:hypothetical protein
VAGRRPVAWSESAQIALDEVISYIDVKIRELLVFKY